MLFHIDPLRLWVHKVLPVVYDDSLSYYEVLAKVTKKLNEVIDLTEEQNQYIEEFSTNLTNAINSWEEGMESDWSKYRNDLNTEWADFQRNTEQYIENWKNMAESDIEDAIAAGINQFVSYFSDLTQTAVDAAERAMEAAENAAQDAVDAVMPTLESQFDERYAWKTAVGSPLVATTAAGMTDTTKVYVYAGSETGYVNGDWYYYDGTTWQDGGVYNSAAVVTDPTLSESGVPADAKAAGDEIADLKSAIKSELILKTAAIGFDQGGLSDTSASSITSSTRIRSHAVLPSNIIGVKVPEGKRIWAYAFANNVYQGRYVGDRTISKSTASGINTKSIYDFLFSDLNDATYDWKIVVSNTDNSNIVPADASGLQYYYATDSTLSMSGKPADALTTHNAINDVDLVVSGAKTQVTEVVNPSMSRTQFVTACDAKWTDYSNLCLCSGYSFWTLNGTTTFEEAYLRLNANFRDDVYVPGMTTQTICDRINHAFATPIHRFESARLNLTVPCDFSVKFSDRSGEPSLIVSADGGELWCYGYGYRFKTNDGMKWTRESIVRDTQNSIGHNGMSVIDDTIYLITRDYQNNNDLLMYTSPLSDGLNFTYRGIVLDKGHDFGDGLSITNWGNSCMCKINGTYYLYIEGKDVQDRNFWDTYLVTCSDPLEPQQGGTIGDWQNSSVAPIISGSVLHPSSSSAVSVGNPDFAKGSDNRPIRDADGKWYLYVHSTAFSYSYIHRLSSTDLVHWTHDGRMYDNRNIPTAGENRSSNADQAIIEFKGRTYFFYTTDINTTLDPHLTYMIDDRPIRDIIAMRP